MFKYIRMKIILMIVLAPSFAWGQQQDPACNVPYPPPQCSIPDGRIPAERDSRPQYSQDQQQQDQKLSKDIYEVTHPVVCTSHQKADGDVVTTCERSY